MADEGTLADSNSDSISEAERIAEDAESGGRHPQNVTVWLISFLALCWSLFQLYIAYQPINSMFA